MKMQVNDETIADVMLQKEACFIMYGDDDPWNQTAADNLEWLKLFKEGSGSGSSNGSDGLAFSQSATSRRSVLLGLVNRREIYVACSG